MVDRSGKITEPKSQTMKAKRRRHEPEFKARVGLEALKGIRTIQEIAKEYQVHPVQVSDWKKKMLEGAGDVFKAAKKKTDEESFEAQREQLHAKIGQQAVEIDQQIGRIFTRLEYPNNDGNTSDSVMDNTYHHGLYSGGKKPSMRSITYGRFKIIKYDVAGNESQVTQLFDLQENSFELLPEHGTPNLATQTAYASVRQRLEEELTRQRIENSDPYAMLGDRTLLRFENNLDDSLPYGNDGTAHSGNTGAIPAYSATVPNPTDYLLDENNAGSLDFEQDNQNYVQVSDNRALDFGNNPFTIEAWVKLETMPTGDNAASIIPVVMKKLTNTSDTALDYMFLAAAGTYGTATSYNKLALHLGSSVITSTLAIPDTNWHHISVALDPANNTVRFTLDSQTDAQTTSATGTANNGPLIIGVHFNSSGVIDSAFDGLIDELSITDGFLAPSELQPLAVVTTPTEFEIKQTALSNDGSQLNITFDSTDTRLFAVQRSYTLEPNSWV